MSSLFDGISVKMLDQQPHTSEAPLHLLWGKTSDLSQSGSRQWLPLISHLLDSAYVAGMLWDNMFSEHKRRVLSEGFIEDGKVSTRLGKYRYQLLAGLHDIGKATPTFLTPTPKASENSIAWSMKKRLDKYGAQFANMQHSDMRHELASGYVLWRILEGEGKKNPSVTAACEIVGSHHGFTPPSDVAFRLCEQPEIGFELWKDWQREVFGAVLYSMSLSIDDVKMLFSVKISRAVRAALAGAVMHADWIASGFKIVDFDPSAESLRESELWTEDRAKEGWSRAEAVYGGMWKPQKPTLELFQKNWGFAPYRYQEDVFRAAQELGSDGGLLLIEAEMGGGKTQAAMAAAEVMAYQNKCNGVLFALPTMTTTDAMFGRVAKWVDALPTPKKKKRISGALLHGKSKLSPQRVSRLRGTPKGDEAEDILRRLAERSEAMNAMLDTIEKTSTPSKDEEDDGYGIHEEARNSLGVLSSVGAATIDQIALGISRQKRALPQLSGVIGKVVVLDEVHTYDPWTFQHVLVLLSYLGVYRVPTVVLSATLTSQQRDDIISFYRYGMSDAQEDGLSLEMYATDPESITYPMMTTVGRDSSGVAVSHTPIEPAKKTSRVVDFEIHNAEARMEDDAHSSDIFVAEKIAELYPSGSIAVIRNTVDAAQSTYRYLKEAFPDDDVTLLHSRMRLTDRQYVTDEIIATFGNDDEVEEDFVVLSYLEKRELVKRPRPTKGRRGIVVATQVIEQSIDIDFDVLFTDIAPMPAILQRAGRVFRHSRGERGEGIERGKVYVLRSWCDDEGVWRTRDDDYIGLVYPSFALHCAAETLYQSMNNRRVENDSIIGEVVIPDQIQPLMQMEERMINAEQESPILADWKQKYDDSRKRDVSMASARILDTAHLDEGSEVVGLTNFHPNPRKDSGAQSGSVRNTAVPSLEFALLFKSNRYEDDRSLSVEPNGAPIELDNGGVLRDDVSPRRKDEKASNTVRLLEVRIPWKRDADAQTLSDEKKRALHIPIPLSAWRSNYDLRDVKVVIGETDGSIDIGESDGTVTHYHYHAEEGLVKDGKSKEAD